MVLEVKEGVVRPKDDVVPKLGVLAPKLNPVPPNPELVAGVEKFPKEEVAGVAKDELKVDVPKDGAVLEVMKEVVGKEVFPKPPNELVAAGVPNDVPKAGVVEAAPKAGVVAPNEKGEGAAGVAPNIEPEVPEPNDPNPVPVDPKVLEPKLVEGVELNAPKPVPKLGVVVGVVPNELKDELPPKGVVEVLPKALVVPPKEKGLLAVVLVLPNMPPLPIAEPVPKGFVLMLLPPKEVPAPNVFVAPKGDAATAPLVGAPL